MAASAGMAARRPAKRRVRTGNRDQGTAERVHLGYSSLLNHLLARPWLALLGLVPLLTIAWIGYRNVGSGFMPAMDEGGFVQNGTGDSLSLQTGFVGTSY